MQHIFINNATVVNDEPGSGQFFSENTFEEIVIYCYHKSHLFQGWTLLKYWKAHQQYVLLIFTCLHVQAFDIFVSLPTDKKTLWSSFLMTLLPLTLILPIFPLLTSLNILISEPISVHFWVFTGMKQDPQTEFVAYLEQCDQKGLIVLFEGAGW